MRDDSPFTFVADLSGAAQRPAAVRLVKGMLSLVTSHDSPTKRLKAAFDLMAHVPGIKRDRLSQELGEIDKLVADIRIPLGAIAGNRNGPLPVNLTAEIEALCRSSMRVLPLFGEDSAQFTLQITWDVENPRSAAHFALALLAASRDLRSRLGRCALAGCGNYFLDDVSRGGKRRLFCCVEHSDIGRSRLYRERQKRSAEARKHK